MSDEPRLKFRDDALEVVGDRESTTIPRIGESVWLQSKTWRVTDVDYLYPAPGSMDYNAGLRSPTVTLRVRLAEDE